MDSLSDPVYLEELAAAYGAVGNTTSGAASGRVGMTLQPLGTMLGGEPRIHPAVPSGHPHPHPHSHPQHLSPQGPQTSAPGAALTPGEGACSAGRLGSSPGNAPHLHPLSPATTSPGRTPASHTSPSLHGHHTVTAHNASPVKADSHTRITNLGTFILHLCQVHVRKSVLSIKREYLMVLCCALLLLTSREKCTGVLGGTVLIWRGGGSASKKY